MPDDPEEIENALIAVRELVANMASPFESLDGVQTQFLYDAVFEVYRRYKREGTIDAICEILIERGQAESDARYKDLAIMLRKYTKGQPYGKYFEKGSLLDPNQDLIVVELGDFDNTPDLQKVILCALVTHISNEMYLRGRDVPKMCIIDEAWKFLDGSNPTTNALIETGFRTSRKHRGSFTLITQDFDIFFDDTKPLAKTAYGCSSIGVIMRQKVERFRQFCQDHEGIFTSYEQQVIENFQEAKEAGFSSFCIKTNGYTSFHRLVVDPISRIMFTTEPTEYQAVEDLVETGMSTFDAVYQVAYARYPDEMALLEEPPAQPKVATVTLPVCSPILYAPAQKLKEAVPILVLLMCYAFSVQSKRVPTALFLAFSTQFIGRVK